MKLMQENVWKSNSINFIFRKKKQGTFDSDNVESAIAVF